MIVTPMDVLEQFPIRKTWAQKQAFREAAMAYARAQGYRVQVQRGRFGVRNILIGEPRNAEYLVTAHYDTPASIGLPNFIAPNNPVVYVFMQLFLVGILLGAALVLGFGVYWLSQMPLLGFWSGYIAYFALLILMIMGPANRSNANDNTSGVVTVLEILHSMPENLRERVCFVLFDMEERGLLGSAVYRKGYPQAAQRQIVLNLDCVGDGDVIQLTPVKKARGNTQLLQRLEAICGSVGKGNKELRLRASGFTAGSSDHKNFPNGVGIMAFRHKKGIGLYCGRIHTWRDTVLEYTNVNILRAAIISLIGS